MKKKLLRKSRASEPTKQPVKEAPRVLIVDDSEMVRNFHSYLLKEAGFEVRTAADGAEGLEVFLREPFDLVITDINMPRMDGFTFIKRVRELDKTVPIIIISTQDEAQDKQKGFDAGANVYLVKPTKPSVLVENIKFLIR